MRHQAGLNEGEAGFNLGAVNIVPVRVQAVISKF